MKLSEAMRAGAALRPRVEHEYFQEDASGQMCSCALGAAYEGLTGQTARSFDAVADRLARTFALYSRVAHPVDGHVSSLKSVITTLNDDHHWAREQIADWLASIGS